MTAIEVEEWEPGIELYPRTKHPHSQYAYNFREDSESDVCACPDAASWPEPRGHHRLSETDPVQAFIDETRSA